MKIIEVKIKNGEFKQYVFVDKIESITELNQGCILHFVSGSSVTLSSEAEEIMKIIKEIK